MKTWYITYVVHVVYKENFWEENMIYQFKVNSKINICLKKRC